MEGIANYFRFAERGTNLGREAKAGLTTFMVMAYILFLNPAILSNMFGAPGSPEALAFIPAASAATALIAGVLTLAMGIDRSLDSTPLFRRPLTIEDRGIVIGAVIWGPRIGITKGVEHAWRGHVAGHVSVSRP